MKAIWGSILMLALGLAGCGGSATPQSTAPAVGGSAGAVSAEAKPAASGALPRVGIQISASGLAFFPLFVARDLNLFQKHGVDATLLIMPPPAAIAAIQKGDLQFMSTIGSAGRANERGLDLKVVDVMLSRPAIVLVGAPGTKTLSDLKGKVVSASTPDDTLTQLAIALLAKRGLPASSYSVLHTGTDNTAKLAAMQNGQAQAAVLDLVNWLQLRDKLQPQGYSELASTLQDIEMPYSGLASSSTILKAQADTVRRTVAAVVEATQVSASDRPAATGVMQKEMGLSPEVAGALFDEAKQVNLWQTNGHATAAGMAFLFQLDQAALKLDKPPTEGQIFDWSYLPK